MIALTVWSGAASAQSTPCPPNPHAVIEESIETIGRVWDRNQVSLDASARTLTEALSCLGDVPAQNLIGRIHQAMALVRYAAGEHGPARRSMITARILDPSWSLPEASFPPDHPYAELWRKATHPGPLVELGPIGPEVWVVDGITTDRAPSERAFLLQVTNAGKVVWTRYLWDLTEVPERARVRLDWTEPPHALRLGLSLYAGTRLAKQTPAPDTEGAWDPQSGSTAAAGAELLARYTPFTVAGLEIAGSVAGPIDPVDGGGSDPSGRAVLLLGGAGWIEELQPYGALRFGGGVHPVRAWTASSGGAETWTLPSMIVGGEGGVRSEIWRVGATVDTELVFERRHPTSLSAYRLQVDGGARVAGPLAVELMASLRREGLEYLDPEGAAVGRRSDRDVRLGAGVGLWF